MSLQPNEVLIIVLVALIVLGPKRLPGAIRSIGRAFRQVREFSTNVRQEMDATLSPPIVESGTPPGSDSSGEVSSEPQQSVDSESGDDAPEPSGPTPGSGPSQAAPGSTDRPTSDGTA